MRISKSSLDKSTTAKCREYNFGYLVEGRVDGALVQLLGWSKCDKKDQKEKEGEYKGNSIGLQALADLKLSKCGLSLGQIAVIRDKGFYLSSLNHPRRYLNIEAANSEGRSFVEPAAREDKEGRKVAHAISQLGRSCTYNREESIRKE